MAEYIIYQAYPSSFYQAPYEARTFYLSNFLLKAAKFFLALGLTFMAISYAPSVWYWAKNATVGQSTLLYETAEAAPTALEIIPENSYQPRFDASLPAETTLKISKIGVNTTVQEAPKENYEEALRVGVWRASDSGTPFNRTEATILAAHRFGYLAWSNIYRRENSFFNLPKLVAGDTVEITYKQRKYVYEIYGESKGADIEDYSADLILYTCEQLNSDVRIFRYARLLEV